MIHFLNGNVSQCFWYYGVIKTLLLLFRKDFSIPIYAGVFLGHRIDQMKIMWLIVRGNIVKTSSRVMSNSLETGNS